MFPHVFGDASTATAYAPAAGVLDLETISRDLQRGAAAPAAPAFEPQWNFIPMDAEPAPDANAHQNDPELERYLVQEIARATRRRPLMKRLARVEEAYAELPGRLPVTTARPTPPPLPPLEAVPQPTGGPPIHQLMEEFGETYTEAPASAEWLRRARRERRRARLRSLFAWVATLAIGGVIIAATMHGLRP